MHHHLFRNVPNLNPQRWKIQLLANRFNHLPCGSHTLISVQRSIDVSPLPRSLSYYRCGRRQDARRCGGPFYDVTVTPPIRARPALSARAGWNLAVGEDAFWRRGEIDRNSTSGSTLVSGDLAKVKLSLCLAGSQAD